MLMVQDFGTKATVQYIKYLGGVWDPNFLTLVLDASANYGTVWQADYDSSGNVHFVYLKSDNTLQYKKYTNSWSTNAQLSAATVATYPSVAVATNGTIFVTYIRGSTIYWQSSGDGGTTWRGEKILTNADTSPVEARISPPHAFKMESTVQSFDTWVAGSASPYNIRIDYSTLVPGGGGGGGGTGIQSINNDNSLAQFIATGSANYVTVTDNNLGTHTLNIGPNVVTVDGVAQTITKDMTFANHLKVGNNIYSSNTTGTFKITAPTGVAISIGTGC